MTPRLIVITGPTASGKSAIAVEVARRLSCEIISADSRQIFREIPIGTAAPTPEEMAAVPHHFVGIKNLDEYYSAACFESDVLSLLPQLWQRSPYAVMCGGSMMYVDAVCRGIDDLPEISVENRRRATEIFDRGGLQQLRLELLELDPVYYRQVDLNNHKRLIHAIEIIYQSGKPYSQLRTGAIRQRPFRIMKFAVDMPRETLFDRINRRVDKMIADGLEQEARAVYSRRHLNSLNTVGYKELFAMFDGLIDRPAAIARIAKNTRVYAKKQLTWLKRDPQITWLKPDGAADAILSECQ
ncbi:tRNA (adenosine(37)-N6)-dimethylallyltransferase MiaA [uncultured Duncaniella sp.]|uniref:tRNA (adenosine(37)-N6)-dimethylallyltransferase MiaA n=1 Tax=uncultured Duncaniella sp. TaxID=2768039 RepID=UPI00265EB7F1|nr:tRNA (adenosine(37)-N6)-dimethylallyltransferase MiaA [uncultured Duncaniella sp.]